MWFKELCSLLLLDHWGHKWREQDAYAFAMHVKSKRCKLRASLELSLDALLTSAEVDVPLLEEIEAREHTSASNTTENVSTSTLEERANTLLGEDLGEGVDGAAVLGALTRGHHHAATHGINGVGGETRESGDTPAEDEVGQEVGATRKDGLDGVVETEVEATVDEDTDGGDDETTVETSNTVRLEDLLVDIEHAVELALATSLGRLVVSSETGTDEVKGVDEEEGADTSDTTRSDVGSNEEHVTVLLLNVEHAGDDGLDGEVERLGGEVAHNIGKVTTPEGRDA